MPHLGCLGILLDLILGLLGPLGAPFWPKVAQDSENSRFFEFSFQIWDPSWVPKSRKIDVKNDVFFRCVFDIEFCQFFNDFGPQFWTCLGSIFGLKTKTSIFQKLSSRLDGSTIFKVSKAKKMNKKRSKIEPKLRPKNARQKKGKKREKREEKERKNR